MRVIRTAALVLLSAGCGDPAVQPAPPPEGPCGPSAFETARAWTDSGRLAFNADGTTALITTAPGYFALALDDPSRCVQVESAMGATPIVHPGSRGPFCTDCARRVSAAVGGGVFDIMVPGLPITLSFGLRDCATWTPVRRGDAPLGAALAQTNTAGTAPTGRAVLFVDVAVFGGVALRPDALLRAASAELSDAQITLRPRTICALSAPDEALLIEDNRHDAIARWAALARARCPSLAPRAADPRALVLVAPCVRRRDSLHGSSAAIDGYTTHIPGGVLDVRIPDAVAVSAGCGATLPLIDGAPLGMPRVLAHELGHFLGLYHPREADGTEDTLHDTTDDNLMSATPTRAEARGLSFAQAQTARLHPWLRVPRAGSERCADP